MMNIKAASRASGDAGVTAGAGGGAVAPDPFYVERNLPSWASSGVVARGRDYYRQGRVSGLDLVEGGGLEARVAGSAGQPYRVEIGFARSGPPTSRCGCPYRWEPLCKHAVAVLIAWQQSETGTKPRLDAAPQAPAPDEASERESTLRELAVLESEDRRRRSIDEGLRVRRTPAGGPLGGYAVSSGDPARKAKKGYRVMVRDAGWLHASCGCVDFATNELGTCKHIECVKRYLGKEGLRRLSAAEGRSRRISSYLSPRGSEKGAFEPAAEIRFHVPPGVAPAVREALARLLDAEGRLRPSDGTAAACFKRLIGQARGAAVDIDPAVSEIFRREEDESRWLRRIESLKKNPQQDAAWRRSAGAMKVKLHPYQKEGILFAVAKRRAFIGDDMGLGKTMQAIGASLLLKELGQVRRVLVVCPASLKFQWRAEIERACGAATEIISGGARGRAEQYRTTRAFFILINYELLHRDLEGIRSLKPELIILDEAQRIKNWQTKTSRTLKRLESPFRLALTGTPLENRLAELQSVAEFLDPRALGAPWKLMPTYARLDEDGKVVGYTDLDHLRRRMGRFLIRRTRPEVLSQLPRRTDNNFWTPITQEQREVHDGLAGRVLRLVNKWRKLKRLSPDDLQRLMMLLTSMRIVCNAYGQHDWKAIEAEVLAARRLSPGLKSRIGSPKLDEFRDVLTDLLETPGQKIVVFSQWQRMLRLADLYVRDVLEAAGAGSLLFCGGLSLKKREELVKRFNEDPAARVFFSTDAGGVGLNLQHAANCVVNLETPWNPAVLEQRVGRVLRMGQKKSVEVVNLISSDCVEERIYNLVAQKKALFAGVFDPAVKDVRFSSDQAASFLDKMKRLVPDGSVPPAPEPPAPDAPPADLDSVAAGKQPASSAAPTAQIDLGPGLSVRVAEIGDGVQLTLPKTALAALQGLRPLLEALLKLGDVNR